MTQTMYAHVNKWIINFKRRKYNCTKTITQHLYCRSFQKDFGKMLKDTLIEHGKELNFYTFCIKVWAMSIDCLSQQSTSMGQ
jgi:hypothetical protein